MESTLEEISGIVLIVSLIAFFTIMGILLFFVRRDREYTKKIKVLEERKQQFRSTKDYYETFEFYINFLMSEYIERELLVRGIVQSKTITDKEFNNFTEFLFKEYLKIIPDYVLDAFQVFADPTCHDEIVIRIIRNRLFSFISKCKIALTE